MSFEVLEKQIKALPEEYIEEVARYVQLLQYKMTVLGQQKEKNGKKNNGLIFGLGKGKFKVPDDINAFDDEVADAFEDYL